MAYSYNMAIGVSFLLFTMLWICGAVSMLYLINILKTYYIEAWEKLGGADQVGGHSIRTSLRLISFIFSDRLKGIDDGRTLIAGWIIKTCFFGMLLTGAVLIYFMARAPK